MARRARVIKPSVDTEDLLLDPLSSVEEAEAEIDAESGEVEKIKQLIYKLRSESPEEEVSVSVRTRLAEWKPWYVLPDMARKVKLEEFDLDKLIADIHEEKGDGNYKIALYYRGRIIRQHDFYTGDPRMPRNATTQVDNKQDFMTLLPVLLKQSSDSQASSMNLMMLMMQQSRESADRAMQAQMQMMGLLIPAMAGDKTDPTVLLARMAEIQKSLAAPIPNQPNITEMLDIVVKLKELTDTGGGEDPTNVLDILKAAIPSVAAALPGILPPPQQNSQAPGIRPALPSPAPIPQVSAGHAPAIQSQPVRTNPAPAPSSSKRDFGDPILNLIGEDVLFFAWREYPSDIAAATLADKLHANGYTLEQLQSHMSQWFAANPQGDWVATLADKGIDLRGSRGWLEQVVSGVVERLSDPEFIGEDDDTGGEGGGDSDDAPDGAISP